MKPSKIRRYKDALDEIRAVCEKHQVRFSHTDWGGLTMFDSDPKRWFDDSEPVNEETWTVDRWFL